MYVRCGVHTLFNEQYDADYLRHHWNLLPLGRITPVVLEPSQGDTLALAGGSEAMAVLMMCLLEFHRMNVLATQRPH